ncbi:M23 family metallopeptidase [Frondihabitans sp. Leaf304]|uniref:M23 family metallopeptidase n=1 Tax=Frondihabitans sp. Leaf304 TaxID=1736329 RepID=UPI000A0606A8|nr:M23 family metallopeptidase [Frondihabitans sp. Leaf304]
MTLYFRSSRTARPTGPRRSRSRARGPVAMLAVGALLAAGAVLGTPLEASASTKYPSWHDVQVAVQNQAVKNREVKSIRALLVSLDADVKAKQAVQAEKGDELQKAQLAYDNQEDIRSKLQAKADSADRVAKSSETRAGQLAAQLGRSGSNDISSDLIANPGKASNLLYKLGAMSKLTEQANGIYSQAVQDRNTAQGLTDQATVATKALGDLKAKADAALETAQAATEEAQAAVDEQSANASRLEAQLASIKADRVLTQTKYNKGEKIRKAKIAAAQARAAAAAAKASGATGVANAQGWTRPAGGYITSGFGYRLDPAIGVYQLHAGTDLGASCGSNIYAAHAGTVIYAGPYGGYGNFVLLDNGDGINTGYGHIVDGGIHVSVGQTVTAGQIIAQVGSTGWSTGCHLHFETRVNTVAQDAVPFMAARGVTL